MALLDLGAPPQLTPRSHRDYAPWLAHRCYQRSCAYCLQHGRDLDADHVEPVSLAPLREKDPTNLLPACSYCNGPGGKWDYHPLKSPRLKCAADTHGFFALDPRRDDLAALYEVLNDGRLDVLPGASYDRALWNRDVLLRLNRRNLVIWRADTLRMGAAADHLVELVATQGAAASPKLIVSRDVMVREVSYRLLFFELFEIPLSTAARAQAEAMRDLDRGPTLP